MNAVRCKRCLKKESIDFFTGEGPCVYVLILSGFFVCEARDELNLTCRLTRSNRFKKDIRQFWIKCERNCYSYHPTTLAIINSVALCEILAIQAGTLAKKINKQSDRTAIHPSILVCRSSSTQTAVQFLRFISFSESSDYKCNDAILHVFHHVSSPRRWLRTFPRRRLTFSSTCSHVLKPIGYGPIQYSLCPDLGSVNCGKPRRGFCFSIRVRHRSLTFPNGIVRFVLSAMSRLFHCAVWNGRNSRCRLFYCLIFWYLTLIRSIM